MSPLWCFEVLYIKAYVICHFQMRTSVSGVNNLYDDIVEWYEVKVSWVIYKYHVRPYILQEIKILFYIDCHKNEYRTVDFWSYIKGICAQFPFYLSLVYDPFKNVFK